MKMKIPNKKNTSNAITLLVFFVELEGFEPSSKRGTNKLSTCLVVDLVFDPRQAQDHQPRA